MIESLRGFFSIGWSIYADAGFWVVVSLVAGGLLHTFVPQESFRKWLGKTSISSIALATGIGVLLPICSCGVVPLGMAMYWSGASLSATLAFMVATPIINPAAAFMAYGLLGPELAVIYIISGFCIPPVVAYLSIFLLPDIQHHGGAENSPHLPKVELAAAETAPGASLAASSDGFGGGVGVMSMASAPACELPRFPGNTGCT